MFFKARNKYRFLSALKHGFNDFKHLLGCFARTVNHFRRTGPKAAMGVYLCESKVAERSGAQFQICFVNRHFAAAHGFKKVFYFVIHSLCIVLSEQRSLISAQGQALLHRNIAAARLKHAHAV